MITLYVWVYSEFKLNVHWSLILPPVPDVRTLTDLFCLIEFFFLSLTPDIFYRHHAFFRLELYILSLPDIVSFWSWWVNSVDKIDLRMFANGFITKLRKFIIMHVGHYRDRRFCPFKVFIYFLRISFTRIRINSTIALFDFYEDSSIKVWAVDTVQFMIVWTV